MWNIYYLNIVWILFWAWVLPKRKVLDWGILRERVWINDTDYNIHMNNASYINKFEYGRWDMLLRNGVISSIKRLGGAIVMYSLTIRYRRELKPFASFEIHSKIVGWDKQNIYVEQRIVKDDFVHAVVMAKMRLMRVTADEVMRAAGHEGASPKLEPEIEHWTEYDRLSSERMRPIGVGGASPISSRKVD